MFKGGKRPASKAFSVEQKKELKKIVKRNVKAHLEHKILYNSASNAQARFSINKAQLYVWNPMSSIAQGTGRSNRIGDDINLDKIEFSLEYYGQSNDMQCVRFVVFWSTQRINAGGMGGPTTITAGDNTQGFIWPGATGSGSGASVPNENELLFFGDDDNTNIVSDDIINLPVYLNTFPGLKSYRKTIGFKGRKCTFVADGNPQYLKGMNLYCGLLASCDAGSNSTLLGRLGIHLKMHFSE
jgi:hypothetical protein